MTRLSIGTHTWTGCTRYLSRALLYCIRYVIVCLGTCAAMRFNYVGTSCFILSALRASRPPPYKKRSKKEVIFELVLKNEEAGCFDDCEKNNPCSQNGKQSLVLHVVSVCNTHRSRSEFRLVYIIFILFCLNYL